MVSIRRFRPSPTALVAALAVLALVTALVAGLSGSAAPPALAEVAPSALALPADPIVPPNASPTVQALAEANARAEAATEASLGAQDQLRVRRAEADRTHREADAARGRADTARAEKDRAFVGVDQLTRAAYQGGDLDQLSALLGSGSPGAYLDKVSLLDSVSTQNQAQVQRFLDAAAAADSAQHNADSHALDATRSASDAQRTADDAAGRKALADRDVAAATAALHAAKPAELAALRGPSMARVAPTSVVGSTLAIAALRAALSQQGKPYVWGATGDDTYDCSGLVQWAYRQVGIELPRTAAAQSEIGTPVNPQDAQVGDLVFFGSPVSHVGIYVGNGHMLNAPQSGDVVKVANVQHNLVGIRRINVQ